MHPPTTPAELLDIEATDDGAVAIVLTTGAGTARARTLLAPAERAALHHVAAIWGHGTGCPGRVDVLRGVLEQVAGALGARPPTIVVRPGEQPAFWLRVHGDVGWRALRLEVLDAIALLLGRRIAVAVEAAPGRAA